MLTSRGLGRVLGDLASMGFDARWGVLGAADVGANHQRDRIWIVAKWNGQLSHTQHDRIGRWEQQQESIEKASNVADPALRRDRRDTREFPQEDEQQTSKRQEEWVWKSGDASEGNIPNSTISQQQGGSISSGIHAENTFAGDSRWWQAEPNLGRVADGVAAGVDRLKAIGNGQVPLCAATAWKILSKDI